ncbi:MAG: DNA repair protein RadC [Myxococcales bacterium]|nr:DNA repair protein RadC [Myxococcales bacterium]
MFDAQHPIGPRERLALEGAAALSEIELLAIVLGTGARGLPVLELARRLVHESGGLRGLARRGLGELRAELGLGPSKAARLLAAFELGRRQAAEPPARRARLGSSQDVVGWLGPRYAEAEVEHFLAVPMDARHRPMGLFEIGKGGMTSCAVSPADVYRRILREAAPAVIFVHNHPSGAPDPSPDDLALTDRLTLAGDLLGVQVLDHVILAREGHFSFLDAGLLGTNRPSHHGGPRPTASAALTRPRRRA